MESRTCPKCAGAMSEGFVADKTYGGALVSTWVEGKPKKSIWLGLKLGGSTPIDIATWRCRRCFYLESYASPE